jgi:alkylated DNA repair dioxygenase AlkB
MDLFDQDLKEENRLPFDGEVYYYGHVLEQPDADRLYQALLDQIDWRSDEAIIFDKKIVTKRKVAWHGDLPYPYTYSRTTKVAEPWTVELLELKAIAEQHSGETYNACLLNLYHDGSEGMAWHSDGERELKKDGAIGSISLGAERTFAFKHKRTKETVSWVLEHGSLLVMKGTTQTHWLHRLPPTKKVLTPRINLTFRTMMNAGRVEGVTPKDDQETGEEVT